MGKEEEYAGKGNEDISCKNLHKSIDESGTTETKKVKKEEKKRKTEAKMEVKKEKTEQLSRLANLVVTLMTPYYKQGRFESKVNVVYYKFFLPIIFMYSYIYSFYFINFTFIIDLIYNSIYYRMFSKRQLDSLVIN